MVICHAQSSELNNELPKLRKKLFDFLMAGPLQVQHLDPDPLRPTALTLKGWSESLSEFLSVSCDEISCETMTLIRFRMSESRRVAIFEHQTHSVCSDMQGPLFTIHISRA